MSHYSLVSFGSDDLLYLVAGNESLCQILLDTAAKYVDSLHGHGSRFGSKGCCKSVLRGVQHLGSCVATVLVLMLIIQK